jgi:hypothetical protein
VAEPSELNLWTRQWRDERIRKARADFRERDGAWQCLKDKSTDYARSIKMARDVSAQVLAVWEGSPVDLPADEDGVSAHPAVSEAQGQITALLVAHRDMIEAQIRDDRAAEVEAVARMEQHRAYRHAGSGRDAGCEGCRGSTGMTRGDDKLTKADTVALWHAVQWMDLCLRQSDKGEQGVEVERERLVAAKRALRKVNAIRKAGGAGVAPVQAPSTLDERIERAAAEIATWSPEKRASMQLQGGGK